MINAAEIFGIIPEGGALVLDITKTKDGNLIVIVDPKGLSSSKVAIAPKVVNGTPEELDKEFMTFLAKVGEGIASFDAAMKSLTEETTRKIEEAKKDGASKVEQAKKTAAVSAKKPAAKAVVSPVISPVATGGDDKEALEHAEIEAAAAGGDEEEVGVVKKKVEGEDTLPAVKQQVELQLF